MANAKLKKISIVFEETGTHNGKGFNVYVEGLERDLTGVPDDQRTPAEFWAGKMFAIVGQLLMQTGAAQQVHDLRKTEGGTH